MNFVVLNDTRDQPHFGCLRVMETIFRLLERRKAAVIDTAPAGTAWERSPPFLRSLQRCDGILINGEGTLHHGHARGEQLLRVVDHPLGAGKPVSIVNALYQANPTEWSDYLAKIHLVVARDGRSHREVAGVYGGRLLRTLDLSLYEPHVAPAGSRHGITIGDSVSPVVTRQLLKLAASTKDATFLPIMRTIKSRNARLPAGIRMLRDAYVSLHALAWRAIHRKVRFAGDDREYLELVGRSKCHVTGRFHGVCLSVLAGVPFLAVASNSWKIEALLEDLGLEGHRLTTVEGMRERLADESGVEFADHERRSMAAALEDNRRRVDVIFDEIVAAAAAATRGKRC